MDRLSKDDMALWHAWKRAAETVRARVVEDVAAATGLSDPDFGVLTRVAEDGKGSLRQNQLADSMGWHRSRLSHHLTRMEQRGLVTRRPVDGGVEVVITDAGRAEVARARPVHAAAVRAHLVEPLGKADRATFFACLAALAESCD
ncbi:MarR family winged helix-turn-helix transcriptional regulator [Amycolatopsis sp. NBC_00348]|uniref:MarR family winged helix-turn-helix transcriptional regulator n=1 Tax=Amycolatopsis sp. NBC_00348 TaxID=2975956 RepID=UPI002E276250